MAMHEDLATLFSRNLTLHNHATQEPAPQLPIHQTIKPEQAITYSITQHYHHSSHVATKPRAASEPPTTDRQTTNIILSRHGVDAATLLPSQVELFQSAEPAQQMRLVELWRICPPNYVSAAEDSGHWPSTSFQQEEAMARLRYERQMLETRTPRSSMEQSDSSEDIMSDGEQSNAPITPIQGGDGRWDGQIPDHPVSEPYMISGYESLARREYEQSAQQQPSKDIYSHFGTAVGGPSYRATDPVYKSVRDIHHRSNVNQEWADHTREQQQAMENQYGVFTQGYGYASGGYDEEML
ncbi:MAG: hypothetical protein M1818_001284 [Claussenomyces sp. TS43310]|nr:MAG: hypothetical protein M1818_001284 [Claussenomyces sp. TS43310]